nr:histidinol dehydrogenase [uncultured Flavobacterium sp.]
MKTYINPERESWNEILKRPTQSFEQIEQTVSEIFTDIIRNKDKAVAKYTQFFDGVFINNFQISEQEIELGIEQVSSDLKQAISLAKGNIETFHKAQLTQKLEIETTPGVICWQQKRAIEKVGIYIPGGSAPLFSTVLMLAIPAQIAGCKDIVLCTPPDKNGNVNPAILYAAKLCGVTKIYRVGGIQAIAALTFGTETIPKVNKIFGPGNQYVTVAKQKATQFGVAIDMPAGPSELLVFADETCNPAFVASDLLSQAEHGPDSQVVLVTTSTTVATEVENEVSSQLKSLPRIQIANQAIQNSKIIISENEQTVMDLINDYAPEHFIIASENPDFFIENINNVGSVFIGNYTPESAGDYASGTNHTLPTNGFAKSYSGITLDSYLKTISFQKISKQGILTIGNAIELMAEAEGLQGHKKAVSIRLKELN